jgi:hypothetical protein
MKRLLQVVALVAAAVAVIAVAQGYQPPNGSGLGSGGKVVGGLTVDPGTLYTANIQTDGGSKVCLGGAGDCDVSINRNGANTLNINASTAAVFSGAVQSATGYHTTSPGVYSYLQGKIADGASAIGVKIGNSNALSNATASPLTIYSDDATTKIVSVYASGQLRNETPRGAALSWETGDAGFSAGRFNGPLEVGRESTNYMTMAGGASGVAPRITVGTNSTVGLDIYNQTMGTLVARFDYWGRLMTTGALRRHGVYSTAITTDTTFSTLGTNAIGLPAPTIIAGGGTCTPAADTANSYQYVKYPTDAASSGHACGISGPFTTSTASFLPILKGVLRSDSVTTSTRVYFGLGASSLDQVATLAGANTIRGCWWRYDTGLSDANWTAESSDGATASATASNRAYSANTNWAANIDGSVSGACDFYVGSASGSTMTLEVHKTSNIPTDTTAIGIESSVTTLTTAARAIYIDSIVLEQN